MKKGRKRRILVLTGTLMGLSPVVYVVITVLFGVFSLEQLLLEMILGSPLVLGFIVVSLAVPLFVVWRALSHFEAYADNPTPEREQRAQRHIGRVPRFLQVWLLVVSLLGPHLTLLSGIVPSLSLLSDTAVALPLSRYLAAALAGPAAILLIATRVYLTLVGVFTEAAGDIPPREDRVYSVQEKLAASLLYAPAGVVLMFSALGFATMYELNTGTSMDGTAMLLRMLVTIGLSAVVIVANLLFSGRQIRGPVQNITAEIRGKYRQLAEDAEADLTEEVDLRTHDEMHLLGDAFNRFMRELRAIIGRARSASESSRSMASRLSSSSDEAATSLREAAEGSGELREQADSMDEHSTNSKDTVKQLDEFTNQLVELMNEQASAMQQASAAVEEMTPSF